MSRLQSDGGSAELAEKSTATVPRSSKRYFGLEWPARHRFHLMVNSSIGDDRRSGDDPRRGSQIMRQRK